MKNCILFMLTLSVALLSCSKEKLETNAASPELSAVSKEIVEAASAAPEYPPVPKVKSSILAGHFTGVYFTYDSLGRQKTLVIIGNTKREHFYEASRVVIVHSDLPSGAIRGRDTLLLNSQGLVTSSTNFFNPQTITYYEYNEGRYLINKKTKNRSGTLTGERKYYYTNYRLDSTVWFKSDGSREYLDKYTNYDLTKKHSLNDYNYGKYYYGRQSAFPHLKYQSIWLESNQILATNIYTYLSDAKGRMINKISKDESGNILSNTNFTYY